MSKSVDFRSLILDTGFDPYSWRIADFRKEGEKTGEKKPVADATPSPVVPRDEFIQEDENFARQYKSLLG